MSLEAQFLNEAASDERSERVRFTETLAVFEDMHGALKARLHETPEHRALDSLDAALALVAQGAKRSGRHLDLDGFAAFRGSVELLHDNTPEARALQLFEGALRSMIASASDFDDLPDVEEEADAGTEEERKAADAAGEAPVVVAIFEDEADPAEEDLGAEEETSDAETDHLAAGHKSAEDATLEPEDETVTADDRKADTSAEEDTAGDTSMTDEASDSDPDEIRQRIVELEAELAAARANQAA